MSRESPDVVEALARLCSQQGVSWVVQVGAEDGYEAQAIAGLTGCRATALEADPRCRPCDGCEMHWVLIGEADTAATDFFTYDDIGLSSRMKRADRAGQLAALPMFRLDTFCCALGIEPDALIVDTEGTALQVLAGCGDLLDRVRLVYAECQTDAVHPSSFWSVDELLVRRGFLHRLGHPAYTVAGQGNFCWVRPFGWLRPAP